MYVGLRRGLRGLGATTALNFANYSRDTNGVYTVKADGFQTSSEATLAAHLQQLAAAAPPVAQKSYVATPGFTAPATGTIPAGTSQVVGASTIYVPTATEAPVLTALAAHGYGAGSLSAPDLAKMTVSGGQILYNGTPWTPGTPYPTSPAPNTVVAAPTQAPASVSSTGPATQSAVVPATSTTPQASPSSATPSGAVVGGMVPMPNNGFNPNDTVNQQMELTLAAQIVGAYNAATSMGASVSASDQGLVQSAMNYIAAYGQGAAMQQPINTSGQSSLIIPADSSAASVANVSDDSLTAAIANATGIDLGPGLFGISWWLWAAGAAGAWWYFSSKQGGGRVRR